MALALVVTNAGRAALLNAQQDGTRAVRVAACGVGPTAIVASPNTAALPGEVKRIATLSGLAAAADIIHMLVRDETRDSYTVRSIALYLSDGTLFAVYGQPDPILEKSAQAILLMPIDVKLADIAADRITFGDAVFVSPPATREMRGIVELATDAEAEAATDAERALTPANIGAILSAARILARMLTVDGAGSGLDADLLDGRHAAEFALLAGAGFTGPVRAPLVQAYGAELIGTAELVPGTDTRTGYVGFTRPGFARIGYVGFATAGGALSLVSDNGAGWVVEGGPLRVATSIVWHAGNDGAGSGLDADLLDGRHGSSYALVAGTDFTGPVSATQLKVLGAPGIGTVELVAGSDTQTGYVSFTRPGTARIGYVGYATASGALSLVSDNGAGWVVEGGPLRVATNIVWHAGNDGAGSGLDADLLDGQQGGWYADIAARLGFMPLDRATYTAADVLAKLLAVDGAGSGLDADLLDGQQGGWYADIAARLGFMPLDRAAYTAADVLAKLLAVAGAGSGLDADLLDGWHRDELRAWANLTGKPDSFPPSAHTHAYADITDKPASFPPSAHAHGAADIAGAFASRSFASDGYQILPGGLILQWVAGAADPARTERSQAITFPLAFPNACLQAFPSTRISQQTISGDAVYQIIGAPSPSGCTVLRQITGSTDDNASTTPLIFAIGF